MPEIQNQAPGWNIAPVSPPAGSGSAPRNTSMVSEKLSKPKFGAKSEFVRSLDPAVPAAEVVAMAEKKEMKLTKCAVHVRAFGLSGAHPATANAAD